MLLLLLRLNSVAMASGKVMDPENLNENVKKTVYAVRGELYLRASELQKEGKKVRSFTPMQNRFESRFELNRFE